jgi:hypothetical protein
MSVQTTADEKIDLAEESVKDATLALSEVVIQECWGSEDLSDHRLLELRECLNELILIKARLRK